MNLFHEYPTLKLKNFGDPGAHMARDATLDPTKHQVDKEHKAFGPRGMAAIGSFSITAGYGNSQSSPLVKHQKIYTYPAHPILSRAFFFWNEVALKKKKNAFRFTTSSRRWLWDVYFPYISHSFCDPSRGICSIVPHPHGKSKLRHLRGETQVDTQVGCIIDILCMDMFVAGYEKKHSQKKTVGVTSYFNHVATLIFLAIFPHKKEWFPSFIKSIHAKMRTLPTFSEVRRGETSLCRFKGRPIRKRENRESQETSPSLEGGVLSRQKNKKDGKKGEYLSRLFFF